MMCASRGRAKVDLYADANLGAFGLLVPAEFEGMAAGKAAIRAVLEHFFFPQLDVVFSASARLLRKDRNDLVVKARLEELETRVTLEALDERDQPVADGLEVLAIFPHDARAAREESRVEVKPNVAGLLSVLPGHELAVGVVAGLGLAFGSLVRPRTTVTRKAFLAGTGEFGWYVAAGGDQQPEGVHYGAAVLQARRGRVKRIKVELVVASDWKGRRVDNQIHTVTKLLDVHEPKVPDTPTVAPPGARDIPVVMTGKRVRELLGVDAARLRELVEGSPPRLVAFAAGDDPDQWVVTGGSFLTLVGMG